MSEFNFGFALQGIRPAGKGWLGDLRILLQRRRVERCKQRLARAEKQVRVEQHMVRYAEAFLKRLEGRG